MTEQTDSQKRIFAINPDLKRQVSPILTNMVSMLLKKKPQDPVSRAQARMQVLIIAVSFAQVPHMVQFLEELQGVATPPLTPEELVELEQLRTKYERLKKAQPAAAEPGNVKHAPGKKKKKPAESDDESSSDSEVSIMASTTTISMS